MAKTNMNDVLLAKAMATSAAKAYTDNKTAALLAPIQAKTTGMTEGGSNYITVGGIRVYVSATAPTGDIPDGSVGVGW